MREYLSSACAAIVLSMLTQQFLPAQEKRESTTAVPAWVIIGILKVETNSIYKEGTLTYVDRRRGAAGERGPMQMSKAAFRQVAKNGDKFSELEKRPFYAVEMSIRYLLWLRRQASSWEEAVEWYNAGPHHSSKEYLAKVKAAGAS